MNFTNTPRQPRGGWLAQHPRKAAAIIAVAGLMFVFMMLPGDAPGTVNPTSLRGTSPLSATVRHRSLPDVVRRCSLLQALWVLTPCPPDPVRHHR